MRFLRPYVFPIIIVLLGAAVYANSLDVPFQFDDSYNTIRNPYITDLKNIPAMFAGAKGTWASRPLLQATIALNFHYGGFETRGYHILNTAVHLINGLLLYLLITLTARHAGYGERKSTLVAFFSSLLFVLHPANTEAVISVVNRSMLFAATFYFLGLILFLKSVTAGKGRSFYIAGLLVSSLLGMASRENFVTFPLMLFAYDLFFISRFEFRKAVGNWKSYLPAMLSLGYMVWLAKSNTYDRVMWRGIQPLHYAFTQLNVQWTYLRLLVAPMNLNVDYNYPTATTLFEFPTILSFAGYLGLWAGAVLFARKKPVPAFAVLWFLVTLLPISFLVAFSGVRLGDVIFEHRLYLPGAAFFPAVVAGLFYAADRFGLKRAVSACVAVLTIVAAAYSIATFERNKVWQTELGLWRDVVNKSPNSERAHYNLGRFLSRADFPAEAMTQYKIALRLDPNDFQAHFNLGLLYMQAGLMEDARKEFEVTLKLKPDHTEAMRFLKYISEPQSR